MALSNPVLQRPRHTARLPKKPKVMTHNLKFSSTVGHLLPVYYDFLYPGDKVRINSQLFTRTQPLHTAALVSLTEHIEYFFVPAHLLNSRFPDFITGVHATPYTTITAGDANTGQLTGMQVSSEIAQYIDQLRTINRKTGGFTNYEIDRLMQHLGYGKDFFKLIADGDVCNNLIINTLRLQAYQKICNDYYWREDFDEHEQRAYNNDFGDYTANADIIRLTELHSCPWKKDYFTLAMPSYLFNEKLPNGLRTGVPHFQQSIIPTVLGTDIADNWELPTTETSTDFLTERSRVDFTTKDGSDASASGIEPYFGVKSRQDQSNANNTNSIRLNLALEKLYAITNFAKKDYVSQVAAHFGYKVNSFFSYRSIKIGSHSQPLDISQVVSTAETSEANLGQVSGIGVGSGIGKKSDFIAPSHGIFMAIYFCYPEADYGGYGLDWFNVRKNRLDFFTPEVDNLGLVPQNPAESNIQNDSSSFSAYTFRYLDEKLKYNKVITGFLTPEFSPWTCQRPAYFGGEDASKYYVPADYLDPIMLQSYQTLDPETEVPLQGNYVTDPLLHVIRHNVIKLSEHSTFGLPSL